MTTYVQTAALAALLATSKLAAQASEIVQTQVGDVRVERLARLDNPWGMTFLPDGRLLITEKPGRLRIFADGRLSEPIAGVPTVAYRAQGGLLDVEIDPDFTRNGLVYLSYAEPADPQPRGARETGDPRLGPFVDTADNVLKGGAVARGRLDRNRLRNVRVIWRQVPKTIGRGHFGGRLVFAPDGKLFITSGERQRFEPAQDLASNLGKIVRINPDGSIPADNPFARNQRGRADIWTLGHRNPLGAAIHPVSRQLWIHEMGPAGGDEVNIIAPGRNYGWPLVSNGDNYDGSCIPDHTTHPKEYEFPAEDWNPSISPSGLLFYTGSRFRAWRGNALMGGLSSQALIRLFLKGNRVIGEERIDMGKRIRDVIQAPDGAVLLLVDGDNGELLRLTPASDAATARRF
jgi:aldose sugar dehydrogenase